jgi:hypothetical protein
MVLAVATMVSAKIEDVHPMVSRGLLDCSNAIPIACGDIDIPGTTIGAPSNVSSYSCVGWTESGPEVVYVFVIPEGICQEVAITIVPDGCDLDLFLLASCEEADCIDYGDASIVSDCLEAGTYYIVVDGYNGATCAYTITVECVECACPEPCPEEQNYLPLYEGFERVECFPPAGWTILNLGDDPAGTSWTWTDNSYICDGIGAARCSYASSSEFQDEWFITPIIYLEGAPGIVVSFQHNMAWWGDCTDPMQVLYSTTGIDPADFTLRLDYTCDLPNPLCGTSTLEIDGLAGEHVYVAWRYQGLYAGSWYVDNVIIEALTTPVESTSWGSIKALYR